MWGKDLLSMTSGDYRLSHVCGEFLEIFEEFPDPHSMWIEVQDTVTTASLWLAVHGINTWVPNCLGSHQKFVQRMDVLEGVLVAHGLYDPSRNIEDPYYWRRYCAGGTNVSKPEKLAAFLNAAKADTRMTLQIDRKGNVVRK